MFQFDTLSFVFVLLILFGSMPNIVYSSGYLSHIQRKAHYQIHYFSFISSMIGVVVSANALVFLFFWELMSLSSWQLILTQPKEKSTIEAARFYFLMTHFGFVFLLLFFLITTNGALEIGFVQMHTIATSFPYQTLLFFFLILGFLSKAGAVPLHVWLPYAHPEAPSPVSALMSGIMLKMAFYGLFRFLFDVLYPWPLQWGTFLLIVGSVTSLVGILYAMAQRDIKALLANSSIENIGIILIAFAMGMIFESLHLHLLSSFSFLAALLHIFNHMGFKSLLFMGAGAILHETHTKDLEKYGGLIKSMPLTAFLFLFGSISITALPPSNGFLSEWMIFQSLLSSSTISEAMTLKLALPFALFALAMTGGLAIATFIKAFGITFLGLHRSSNAKHAKEVNFLMKSGMLMMALFVASMVIFVPFFLKLFDTLLVEKGHVSVYAKLFPSGFLEMHSLGVHGGIVSPLFLFALLLFVTLLLLIAYKLLRVKKRVSHTWACGYKISAKTQYSAMGFSGVMRRFFAWLYRAEEKQEKQTLAGHSTKFTHASYTLEMKALFEVALYDNTKKWITLMSYWVYRLGHFEQTRYPAMIFNLMLFILYSYRIFTHEIDWQSIMIESALMFMSLKILVIGEKK